MRVFALSDIHVDYGANAQWLGALSSADYCADVLLLAGDVSHRLSLLAGCLGLLASRFKKVLFVPGNHELWVTGKGTTQTSLQKFAEVAGAVERSGASMQPLMSGGVMIVPLLGWYDYSFGEPDAALQTMWMDYHACRWPADFDLDRVAAHFSAMNPQRVPPGVSKVITFSHFLPRIDLVPGFVPGKHRLLDPVLGSRRLEGALRELSSTLHVYGHSHINRRVTIDGVTYINNALGYPGEESIAARRLVCIDEI